MLVKMSEFLKTLPPKTCCSCGKSLKEQHECYTNKCEDCNKLY